MPVSPECTDTDGGGAPTPWKQVLWLGLLIAAIVFPLLYLHVIDVSFMPPSHSDLLPRWVGTRAALQGQSPYSPAVLREIQKAYYGRPLTPADHARPQAFFYPAYLVVLLAPLSLLSWNAARLVFFLLTAPLLVWSLWLCMRTIGLPHGRRAAAATVIFACFSWPIIWGLRLEQLTIPVAAAIFAACYLLCRGRQVLPGILFGLAAIKPQLILLLLVWLLLWAGLRRMWLFIISFATTFAVLLAASEWVVPGWIGPWLESIRGYGGVMHIAPPLEWVFGHWGGLAATVALTGASLVTLWRWRRCAPGSQQFGMAMSLALAATVTFLSADPPMIYNLVLLFPACLILVFRQAGGAAASTTRVLALAQLAFDYLALPIALISAHYGHDAGPWFSLPFIDFLLPALATSTLLLVVPTVSAPSSDSGSEASLTPQSRSDSSQGAHQPA